MRDEGLIVSWDPAEFGQTGRSLIGGFLLLIAVSLLICSSSLVPGERLSTDRDNVLWLRGAAAVFSFAGCALLVHRQTIFCARAKSIRMQRLLLGRWLLCERRMNFDQFTAIMVRRYRGSGDNDHSDTVFVSLNRENASKLAVSYYNEGRANFASEAAHVVHAIARVTGLPIDGAEQLEPLK